jgi:hypothetical protein
MNPVERLKKAPRCRARSKRTGNGCRAPAVQGWNVCRFHGAGGGAPRGPAHGNYKHGGRTKELLEAKRVVTELQRMARETLDIL